MGVQIIIVAKHYCTTYMFLSNELSLFDYCVVSFFASRVILFFFTCCNDVLCMSKKFNVLYIDYNFRLVDRNTHDAVPNMVVSAAVDTINSAVSLTSC
jgi:hypothetical protein